LKRIALLGSTGSVGTSTLDVVAHLGDRLSVASLAAGSNWQLLAEQARTFRPDLVAIADEGHVPRLSEALSGTGIEVVGGADGVAAAAAVDGADAAFVAIVGAAGLPASFAALSSGKALALANKESLVMAGELLTGLAREKGVPIIPVDSEHSAIHQCLRSGGAARSSGLSSRHRAGRSGGSAGTTSSARRRRWLCGIRRGAWA